MKHIKLLSFVLIVVMSVSVLASCERLPVTNENFISVLDSEQFEINNVELNDEHTALGVTTYVRAATTDDNCRFQFIEFETYEQAKSAYTTEFKDDIYSTGSEYATVQDDISETDFDYIHATVDGGLLVAARVGNTILAASADDEYGEYVFSVLDTLGYNK